MSTPERRNSERRQIHLGVTLTRPRGNAVPAETLDVGAFGMCVCTTRPLAVDELLVFEIALGPVSGRARVLREQGRGVYALRFERLEPDSGERLQALLTG